MTVYAIFNYDVEDPDGYARYQGQAASTMGNRKLDVLALDTETTTLEGDKAGHQTVILAFESEDAFYDWYRSPGYQEAIPTRQGATRPTLAVLAKGLK